MRKPIALCLLVVLLTGACASVPSGPSVMVLPGSGKDFGQFQQDDSNCRQFAEQQIGTTVNESGAKNTATGAAIGTLVGAGNAQSAQYSVQKRYDASYVQCMYSRGNQVPVARGSMPAYQQPAAATPPPPPPPPPAAGSTPTNYVPPPPAGTPPPPPPPR